MSALIDHYWHYRTMARANRLMNHRLHTAVLTLPSADFMAPRVGFFPSLGATLNHILIVDWYYVAALEGRADMRAAFRSELPCATAAELVREQAAIDGRLIAWCDAADAARLGAEVTMDRVTEQRRDPAHHVLDHLFMHQIHHRGQAHAMLSSTACRPPQLDDFLLPSDASVRGADLAALGWTERDLFPARPAG